MPLCQMASMWLILPMAPLATYFSLRLDVDPAGALLQADLADAPVDARGLHHHGRLVAGAAHGLLDVDVLAGVHGIDGVILVPVVGRADQDGVHFLQLEEFPVIAEGLGVGRLLLRLVDVDRVDVAQRAHLQVGVLLEQAHDVGAAVAGADDAEPDAVVRAENSRIRECCQMPSSWPLPAGSSSSSTP